MSIEKNFVSTEDFVNIRDYRGKYFQFQRAKHVSNQNLSNDSIFEYACSTKSSPNLITFEMLSVSDEMVKISYKLNGLVKRLTKFYFYLQSFAMTPVEGKNNEFNFDFELAIGEKKKLEDQSKEIIQNLEGIFKELSHNSSTVENQSATDLKGKSIKSVLKDKKALGYEGKKNLFYEQNVLKILFML